MLDAEDLCRILVQQKDKETASLFLFFFEKRPRLFTRCFAVVVILLSPILRKKIKLPKTGVNIATRFALLKLYSTTSSLRQQKGKK